MVRARHQGGGGERKKRKKNTDTEARPLLPLQNADKIMARQHRVLKLALFTNDDLIHGWMKLPRYNKRGKKSLRLPRSCFPVRDSNILCVSDEQAWMVGHDWVQNSSWEQDTQGRSGKMNSSPALTGPCWERVCMKLIGAISSSHNMFAQQNKSKGAIITL